MKKTRKPQRMAPFQSSFPLRTVLQYILIIAVVGVLMAYAVFQAQHLIQGPKIALTEEPEVLQHEQAITIKGTTKNIVALTLNGRDIYTDKDGMFRELLVLERGYTIMTLHARDRYGRETALTRPLVYQQLETTN